MKTHITRIMFTVIAVLAVLNSSAQSKQYVCTPCGSDCDSQVYDHAGSCSHCGMALVEKTGATVTNLSLDELCDRIDANPRLVLLDVRSSGEFSGNSGRVSFGRFKNAININIDELEGRVDELSKYREEEIIVYCSHSHRSPRATYFLTTQGFKNVKNMEGGVSTFTKPGNDCLKSNFVFH